MADDDDEAATAHEFRAPISAECTGTVVEANDGRYCSMTLTLSHVVKNQELVYAALNAEFHFTCDIDAHQCTPEQKRAWLEKQWGTRTFCVVDHANVDAWVRKAHAQSLLAQTTAVVCLCPARTNTEYFHNIILRHATQVRFLKGRLRMKGHAKQSPFPSCLVVFGSAKIGTSRTPKAVFARDTNDVAMSHV